MRNRLSPVRPSPRAAAVGLRPCAGDAASCGRAANGSQSCGGHSFARPRCCRRNCSGPRHQRNPYQQRSQSAGGAAGSRRPARGGDRRWRTRGVQRPCTWVDGDSRSHGRRRAAAVAAVRRSCQRRHAPAARGDRSRGGRRRCANAARPGCNAGAAGNGQSQRSVALRVRVRRQQHFGLQSPADRESVARPGNAAAPDCLRVADLCNRANSSQGLVAPGNGGERRHHRRGPLRSRCHERAVRLLDARIRRAA